MTGGLGQLSRLTKLPEPELLAIAAQVKANTKALEECRPGPHDFSVDTTPDRTIGKRWKCSKCGGEVDHGIKVWYEKGLKDGAQHD
jgi:hypothetical protein